MKLYKRLTDRISHSSRAQLAVTVLGCTFALLATIQFLLSMAVLLQPREMNYGEAMVYDQAARLLRGEPLYQPVGQPPYTIAVYTPLYYMLAASLQAAIGPGLGPGRGLSFLAGLVAAGLVAYLTARQASDRRAGTFAALLFVALGMVGPFPWWAQYRVDVLGVALSLASISVLVGGPTWRRVVMAGVLAALAILTKQTMFAAGVAGAWWLWHLDRQKALLFAGTCVLIVLGTSATLELTSGAFIANAIAANVVPFHLDQLLHGLKSLVDYQAGLLALAGLFVLSLTATRRRTVDGLLGSYWVVSLLPIAALGKVGSNFNYWIEPAAITAVLATLALWSRLDRHAEHQHEERALAPILLIAVNIAVASIVIFSSAVQGFRETLDSVKTSAQFNQVVERVRSEPREVLADPLDVIVLAGRRNLFEPWSYNILRLEGRWDPAPIVRRICAHDIGLLVINYPLEEAGPIYSDIPVWPWPVLAALRETMVLEKQAAGRFLYVPGQGALGAACSPAGQ